MHFWGRAGLTFLVLAACAGCSIADDEPGGEGAPAPAVEAPDADVTVWGPVSMVLPRNFIPVAVPSTGTARRFGARAATSTGIAGPAAITAVVQDAPERKARAEAELSARRARSAVGAGASSIVLARIRLPGADDAWSLDYDEGGVGGVHLHTAAVVADVGPRTVVIQARAAQEYADEYARSGLAAALASTRFGS